MLIGNKHKLVVSGQRLYNIVMIDESTTVSNQDLKLSKYAGFQKNIK
jgi:hypothetical protein